MVDAYIEAVDQCESFDQGNHLSNVFEALPMLTDQQVNQLVDIFNDDPQVNGSSGFD